MKLRGILIASAALGLLAAGPAAADSHEAGESNDEGSVKCAGINGCSGKGECAATDGSHECSGKNGCKGKGWVKVSGDECTDKGGTAQE